MFSAHYSCENGGQISPSLSYLLVKKLLVLTIILPLVANRKKRISLKSLEQAKKTLVFPWSHQGLSPDDLSPANLAAVEKMQAKK